MKFIASVALFSGLAAMVAAQASPVSQAFHCDDSIDKAGYPFCGSNST